MYTNKLQAVADLAHALSQADHYLPREQVSAVAVEYLDFMMFQQMWSDTSLGFGGMAGRAFTEGTVVVCWRTKGRDAVVFVGGRMAYPVHRDDPRCHGFWQGLATDEVRGAADWSRECKHRLRERSNVCEFCGRGQPLGK